MAIRGRYIEDVVAHYVQKKKIVQVLNVAAGLNAYPYRNPSAASLKKYAELDLPLMLQYKKEAIKKLIDDQAIPAPPIAVDYVPVDLASKNFEKDFSKMDWDWSEPTICVFEGISYYLPMEILQCIVNVFADRLGPDSILIMDYFPDYVRSHEGLHKIMQNINQEGGETCLTYFAQLKLQQLLNRYRILSDRTEGELEPDFYPDRRILKPIGSIVVAEVK